VDLKVDTNISGGTQCAFSPEDEGVEHMKSSLMMEAASTSESSVNFYELHGASSQKTVIFVVTGQKLLQLRAFVMTDNRLLVS
jgi:hypothetical protein